MVAYFLASGNVATGTLTIYPRQGWTNSGPEATVFCPEKILSFPSHVICFSAYDYKLK